MSSSGHKELSANYQNIVIDGILYNVQVNPNVDSPGNSVYINCPPEVENFIKTYEQTLIPHYVIGETETYLFYYKDASDFSDHVIFENSSGKTKSLRGANISQWDNANFTGASITETNTSWLWYQPIPTTYAAISAWGIRNPWVGNALNDRISIIGFYMYDGSEPITYVAYQDIMNTTCYSSCNLGTRKVVITKMKALGANGQNIGQNNAFLWNIGMTWYHSWNDEISAYEWWQSPVTLNTGIQIR